MTVLTVIAGAVDAVSFLTPGKVFRALVTGNVRFPSFAPAGAGDVPVARAAAAFATGAAGRRPDAHRARRAGPPLVRGGAGRGGAADRRGLGGTRPARPREGRRPHRLRGGRRGGPGDGATGVHRAAHACARHAGPAEPDRPRGVGRPPAAPPPHGDRRRTAGRPAPGGRRRCRASSSEACWAPGCWCLWARDAR
ncbi:DUF1275 family protein [Streptomyces cellulosae]